MEDSFIFIVIGALYFLLGFPLFLQKVKRNDIYGFRIKKTLSDDKYWYPVNKSSGKWFMISGVLIICAALTLPYLDLEKESLFWIMITLVTLGTFASVFVPYRLLKKIQ